MKKVAQTKWSFWTWLLGGGTGSGGAAGWSRRPFPERSFSQL